MTQNIESMEENPFWDFSLKFYDQKNVATSCLALQEDVGADVNLLLYCCWVASQGAVVIETAEFVEIIDAISPWHLKVIKRLRQIRRDIKKGSACDLGVLSEGLRQSIKKCELEGERVEQIILYESGVRNFPITNVPPSEKVTNAKINLTNYLLTIAGVISQDSKKLVRIIGDELILYIKQ